MRFSEPPEMQGLTQTLPWEVSNPAPPPTLREVSSWLRPEFERHPIWTQLTLHLKLQCGSAVLPNWAGSPPREAGSENKGGGLPGPVSGKWSWHLGEGRGTWRSEVGGESGEDMGS